MPWADPEKNKSESRRRDSERRAIRTALLSEYSCISCSDLDPEIIQWHHIDPAIKDFRVSHMSNSEDRWWNEVLKCVPLCPNCHTKIHKNKLCLIPPKLR